MKGAIQPNHIPLNKYQLLVLGLPQLTPIEFSGIEDELQTQEMPDRTVASGGHRGATEATMMLPAHHDVENFAMELWYRESQDPVSPTYKRTATLVMQNIDGSAGRTYTLVGVFPKKRSTPDLELENEGEMAGIEWVLSIDDVLPI